MSILDDLFDFGKSKRLAFFNKVGEILHISNEISEKKKSLNKEEYNLLLEKKDEVFLSLGDFLYFMEKEDFSYEDIVTRCKSVSELDRKASVVEISTFLEGGHIVLCPDKNLCKKHKNAQDSKLRIVTLKVVD